MKAKILYAIPTQEFARAAIFYDYVDSIETEPDWEIRVSRAHSQSPARNRNVMIAHAIQYGCTHILFIDDDCLLPPDTLKKLMSHDVDIVTGLYLMRSYPHRPIIFEEALDDGRCVWRGLNKNDDRLIEIKAAGLGACLIKIDVFKKIAETNEHWVTLGELEADNWCDDLSFFKRVRSAGFKIYCDTKAPVGHIAKATVWPNKADGEWCITYDTEGAGTVSVAMVDPRKPTSPDIPVTMKSPGDPRPTWRNGVIQIHITRVCELACTGCTQGSNLAGKPVIMSLENFERAVKSLKTYYGVVGIFGGNPTLHPQFGEICKILRKHIPLVQCGLWSNNLNGWGEEISKTFNPNVSNLNVHTDVKAYEEMINTFPGCQPIGLQDSRHSPPFVALRDMEDMTDAERWELIGRCDVNQLWSAMVCQFRGELRAFFCELAGAQSMLHEHETDYPDTGLQVTDEWWQLPIGSFENQIRKHCFDCGIPLRGAGSLATTGQLEFVSKTHEKIYQLKRKEGKLIVKINKREQLGTVERATDYIANGLIQ